MTLPPTLKSKLTELISELLYKKVEILWNRRFLAIVQENNLLQKNKNYVGFSFRGEIYYPNAINRGPYASKLHLSLHTQMDALLQEIATTTNEEKDYVMGYIIKSLNLSNNCNDFLRVLPETFHPIINLISKEYFLTTTTPSLSDEIVQKHLIDNSKTITLLKSRLATNLLI